MSERKNERPDSKLLILVRGLPGAGKTEFSRELSSRFCEGCERLNPDEIRTKEEDYDDFINELRLRNPGVSSKYYPYRYLRNRAKRLLNKGEVVIWDQPWTWFDGIRFTVNHLDETVEGKLQVFIIDVESDPVQAWKRVETRVEKGGHGPDKETFGNFIKDFRTAEELPYESFLVNGQGVLEEEVDEVLLEINERRN